MSDPSQETEDLDGSDNGLYQRLVGLAQRLDYSVVDDDELTKGILTGGRKGLRKRFYSGWVLMVKQGSLLQMTATLTHELAHHFTPEIQDEEGRTHSESVAEGVAFVVTDHYGLDISSQVFPYIAGYNAGIFTQEIREGIENISTKIVAGISENSASQE